MAEEEKIQTDKEAALDRKMAEMRSKNEAIRKRREVGLAELVTEKALSIGSFFRK